MLEFMQKFDGGQPQLSNIEKAIAEAEFIIFVDHMLSKWQHKTMVEDIEDVTKTRVILEDSFENHILRFEVGKRVSGDKKSAYVNIAHVILSGKRETSHTIHMYGSHYQAEVLRFDSKDFAKPTIIYNPTGNLLLDIWHQNLNEEENVMLSINMGHNYKPVALGEVQAAYAAALFAEPLDDQRNDLLTLATGIGFKR